MNNFTSITTLQAILSSSTPKIVINESIPETAGNNSTRMLPALTIFNLNQVLIPYCVDQELTTFPWSKKDGIIYDKNGNFVSCGKEITQVFQELKKNDVQIVVYCNTNYSKEISDLITLFDWDKYISYKEIRPRGRMFLFNKIREKSNIPFSQMLLFDVVPLDPQDHLDMKIFVIDLQKPITMKILNKTLKDYKEREINKIKEQEYFDNIFLPDY